MNFVFLFLLFIVKASYGYEVKVTYGVDDKKCEWSIRGPPFREVACSADGCNNAVHTCLSGCPNGDPAPGMDKRCYFNDVPVADEGTTVSATSVELYANITVPCNYRVPPCGGADCLQLIGENGSLSQTCGFSCPIPFAMEDENNASACVVRECPSRIPANYLLTLVSGTELDFGDTSPNSVFVVKIADKKVFQSQVVMDDKNPILNKGVSIAYGTSSVGIEVHNYNSSEKNTTYIGRVTAIIGEVATEGPSSHYLKGDDGGDVGIIKLKRTSNLRACGSSGWCTKNFESGCKYEDCTLRMVDATATVPCGPECYQQVNFHGALQTSCGPACSQGYLTHESGQCVFDATVEEDVPDNSMGLIIPFGIVLPIMIVAGLAVVVISLCVLIRLNRKRKAVNVGK